MWHLDHTYSLRSCSENWKTRANSTPRNSYGIITITRNDQFCPIFVFTNANVYKNQLSLKFDQRGATRWVVKLRFPILYYIMLSCEML